MRILYLPNSYSQQRQHEKKANIYPVLLAMQAEWYRKQGHEVRWINRYDGSYYYGEYDKTITEPENLSFLTLPRPDRVFTRAKKYISGNYKYLPGTHILSASGCWWGKCSFCVENKEKYKVRPVEDVISEIEECKSLGFKEVFDDSATFPIGDYLDNFCTLSSKLDIVISANMRITKEVDFKQMKNAGFRMLLFGIESANEITLAKINKGVKSEDIIPCLKSAAAAGLDPHVAVMFGYPWETRDDARRTLKLVHYLLRKGYAKTAQASLYCPQGVPGNEAHKKYVKKIYNAAFMPGFWWVRRNEDINFLWRGVQAWLKR